MVQDRTMLTMADEHEVVHHLLIDAIFNDLEWPVTHIPRSRQYSTLWAPSATLCFLLMSFLSQFDAISAHRHTSLVSDKHVPACRFQSASPGSRTLVWFSCSQGWKWMVHITVTSCCSNSCDDLSNYLQLLGLLSSAPRVRKSTELLRHKTPDRTGPHFTPDVWAPDRSDLDPVD